MEHFRTGGWGHEWVGDPDQGVGQRQPGGWIYNILPYIEERELHDLGAGLTGAAATDLYSQRMQTPIALLVCPSRRTCAAWPIGATYTWVRKPKPYGDVAAVARADYAINAGTSTLINYPGPTDSGAGQRSRILEERLRSQKVQRDFPPANVSDHEGHHSTAPATRICLVKSIWNRRTTKLVFPPATMRVLYAGYCSDLHRFAGAIENLKFSLSPYVAPLSDQSRPTTGMPRHYRFGSSHPPDSTWHSATVPSILYRSTWTSPFIFVAVTGATMVRRLNRSSNATHISPIKPLISD